jgi:hypothetical protein
MSPLKPPKENEKNGRQQGGGGWTILILAMMALGMIGVMQMGRMQAQQKLNATKWEPKAASGTSAGFEIKAGKKDVTFRLLDTQHGLGLTTDTLEVKRFPPQALDLGLLNEISFDPGSLAIGFISNKGADTLKEEPSNDPAYTTYRVDEVAQSVGQQTTVLIVAHPAGLLDHVKIAAVDIQGIRLQPDAIRSGDDGLHQILEYSGRKPGSIQFLYIEPAEKAK